MLKMQIILFSLTALLLSPQLTTISEAEPLSKKQGDIIIDELRQIRKLLQHTPEEIPDATDPTPQPEERVSVNIVASPMIGKKEAPLTMVLFTDYQCPFCVSFETKIFPEIKRKYIDTGKLRFVVQDLPLPSHQHAVKDAEATYCAEEQGKYWEFRKRLILNPETLDAAALPFHASKIGLDAAKFTTCLKSGRFSEKVKASAANATSQNINGTPTIIIGRKKGAAVEGIKLIGALPFVTIDQKIKKLLKEN